MRAAPHANPIDWVVSPYLSSCFGTTRTSGRVRFVAALGDEPLLGHERTRHRQDDDPMNIR